MHKTYALLFAIFLALAASLGALADSTEGVYCGDLPAADCQILQDSAEAMNELNALAFDANMTMSFDFGETMDLAGRVYGAFEFDEESIEAIEDMSAQLSMANLNALVDMVLTSAKANLSIEMSGVAADEAIDLDLDLRLKDGVLLLGAEALEAMTGESMEGMEGFGIDLNGALEAVLAESDDLSSLDEGASIHDDSAMKAAEAAATSVKRLADSEVNGVAVAVFETEVDVNALLSMGVVEQAVAASGGLESGESMEALLDSINFRALSTREYIGLDDRYTYRIDMKMDMTMTLDDGAEAIDGALVMDMRVDLSDFNQPVAVEIPEDIFVFPLTMMMQMGEQ